MSASEGQWSVRPRHRGCCGSFLAQFPDSLIRWPPPRRGFRRLAEPDIAQPHIVEELQLRTDRRDVFEENQALPDGHVQNLGDVFILVAHLEGIPIETVAMTDVAGHIDIGEEVHLDLDQPVPLAGLATPPSVEA